MASSFCSHVLGKLMVTLTLGLQYTAQHSVFVSATEDSALRVTVTTIASPEEIHQVSTRINSLGQVGFFCAMNYEQLTRCDELVCDPRCACTAVASVLCCFDDAVNSFRHSITM